MEGVPAPMGPKNQGALGPKIRRRDRQGKGEWFPAAVIGVLAIVAFFSAAAAVMTNDSTQKRAPTTWYVQVGQGGFNFDPFIVTIGEGDTVQWNWTGGCHTSTSDVGATESWNSGTLCLASDTFSKLFTLPGMSTYHCDLHLGMTGRVIVDPSIPESSPAGFLFSAALVAGLLVVCGLRSRKDAVEDSPDPL